MNLIEKFESLAKQDVRTFERVFKQKIKFSRDLPVEILGLTTDGERLVKVGDEIIRLNLKINEQIKPVRRKADSKQLRKLRNRSQNIKKRQALPKTSGILPDLFRTLTAEQFRVYSAVKLLGKVTVTELETQLNTSVKTLYATLRQLEELKMVNVEKILRHKVFSIDTSNQSV